MRWLSEYIGKYSDSLTVRLLVQKADEWDVDWTIDGEHADDIVVLGVVRGCRHVMTVMIGEDLSDIPEVSVNKLAMTRADAGPIVNVRVVAAPVDIVVAELRIAHAVRLLRHIGVLVDGGAARM
jgi:hypothetical protein